MSSTIAITVPKAVFDSLYTLAADNYGQWHLSMSEGEVHCTVCIIMEDGHAYYPDIAFFPEKEETVS